MNSGGNVTELPDNILKEMESCACGSVTGKGGGILFLFGHQPLVGWWLIDKFISIGGDSMKVSEDLIVISNADKHLIYNYEWNKAVIVNDKTKTYLTQSQNDKTCELKSIITDDEINSLEKNGIIFNDTDEYESKKYKYKLFSMDKGVNISTVYFHITQRCNLRCTYCYNMENLNKPDQLTTDDIKNVIDQMKTIGIKTIIFTGGEVLLRRDIIELSKHVKFNNMRCQILSNGVLLHKRKEVMKYVDKFIISLDTLIEENNLRLGLKIPHLIKNLANIPSGYKDKFTVRSVISKTNQKDWKDVADYVENQLGMKHLATPFIPNSTDDYQYMANLDEFPTNEEDCNLSGNVCGASYQIIAIDSSGDIYPCQCLIKEKLRITNIFVAVGVELYQKTYLAI